MDGYTKIKTLGKGAYGDVILAKMSNKQISAIKISKHKKITKDIIIETLILKGLKHPNLIKIKNILKHGNSVSLELERMDSQAQYENITEFKEALREIVSGIEHLHLNGFSHNDLKPGNILRRNHTHKVADFGMALYHGLPKEFEQIKCPGTAMYTAPECAGAQLPPGARYSDDVDTEVSSDTTPHTDDTPPGTGLSSRPSSGPAPIPKVVGFYADTTLMTDIWAVGVLMYDYVYEQLKLQFPWDWRQFHGIYQLQYTDDLDALPVGWTWKMSSRKKQVYYIPPNKAGSTYNAPLLPRQIISHIGRDGYDLMRICMTHDLNTRPTATQILSSAFLGQQEEQHMQWGQSGGDIIKGRNLSYLMDNRFNNELQYFYPTLHYLEELNTAATAGFTKLHDNIYQIVMGFYHETYERDAPAHLDAILLATILYRQYTQSIEPSGLAINKQILYLITFLSMAYALYESVKLPDTWVVKLCQKMHKGKVKETDVSRALQECMLFLNKIDFSIAPRVYAVNLHLSEIQRGETETVQQKLEEEAMNQMLFAAAYAPRMDQIKFTRTILANTLQHMKMLEQWPRSFPPAEQYLTGYREHAKFIDYYMA